jgi:outer membrane immunogenic protein
MNRLTLSALAGLLATVLVGPSFGADIPRKAPLYSAPPPFSWSGFYVGINGGYGWGKSIWGSALTVDNLQPKGWLAGGTLGYNLQTGSWVWGLEGDIDFSTMDATGIGTGACAGATGCQTKNRWLATTRARLGYARDRWLPFITGGAAFGDVKMTPNNGLSETKTKVGWTVGGGVEYAFMGAWSAKIEYLYVDLGMSTCSAATCGIDTDVSYRSNIVRAGVNYRF